MSKPVDEDTSTYFEASEAIHPEYMNEHNLTFWSRNFTFKF